MNTKYKIKSPQKTTTWKESQYSTGIQPDALEGKQAERGVTGSPSSRKKQQVSK
jgi:hypothetical protein